MPKITQIHQKKSLLVFFFAIFEFFKKNINKIKLKIG
jgi:hypothetical protein